MPVDAIDPGNFMTPALCNRSTIERLAALLWQDAWHDVNPR